MAASDPKLFWTLCNRLVALEAPHRVRECLLVSWCSEPSMPQRIISGLKTISIYLFVTLCTSHLTTIFHAKYLTYKNYNSLSKHFTQRLLQQFIFYRIRQFLLGSQTCFRYDISKKWIQRSLHKIFLSNLKKKKKKSSTLNQDMLDWNRMTHKFFQTITDSVLGASHRITG